MNYYQIRPELGEIILFPEYGPHSPEVGKKETNDIVVEISPLFIPEKSVISSSSSSSPSSYVWAYKIQMTVDSKSTKPKAKLKTRKWKIKDENDNVKYVSGIVNRFLPVMYPGAVYEYKSFCTLSTPSGSMKGSLKMVYVDSGIEFDVEVPKCKYCIPQGWRLGIKK